MSDHENDNSQDGNGQGNPNPPSPPGLNMNQQQLHAENERLKRLAADLEYQKMMIQAQTRTKASSSGEEPLNILSSTIQDAFTTIAASNQSVAELMKSNIEEDKLPLAKALKAGLVYITPTLPESSIPSTDVLKKVTKKLQDRQLISLAQMLTEMKNVDEAVAVIGCLTVPEVVQGKITKKGILDTSTFNKVLQKVNSYRSKLPDNVICKALGTAIRSTSGSIDPDDDVYSNLLGGELQEIHVRIGTSLNASQELEDLKKEIMQQHRAHPYSPSKNKGGKKGNGGKPGGKDAETKVCFRFLAKECGYHGQQCFYGKHCNNKGDLSRARYEALQAQHPHLANIVFESWCNQQQPAAPANKGQGKGAHNNQQNLPPPPPPVNQ